MLASSLLRLNQFIVPPQLAVVGVNTCSSRQTVGVLSMNNPPACRIAQSHPNYLPRSPCKVIPHLYAPTWTLLTSPRPLASSLSTQTLENSPRKLQRPSVLSVRCIVLIRASSDVSHSILFFDYRTSGGTVLMGGGAKE